MQVISAATVLGKGIKPPVAQQNLRSGDSGEELLQLDNAIPAPSLLAVAAQSHQVTVRWDEMYIEGKNAVTQRVTAHA
jgi:hypothetical protein